jgi:hypothetical protein
MSLALHLFQSLCDVGNALEYYRDMHMPGSDQWVAMTEILGMVDESVDMLVCSTGLGGADDA